MAAGAGTHAGGRCEHHRPAGGYLGVRLSAADAELKSVRAANYIRTLRRDLVKVAEACGNDRWWRMSRRGGQATSVRTRRFREAYGPVARAELTLSRWLTAFKA